MIKNTAQLCLVAIITIIYSLTISAQICPTDTRGINADRGRVGLGVLSCYVNISDFPTMKPESISSE